jgi:hypothetical protein
VNTYDDLKKDLARQIGRDLGVMADTTTTADWILKNYKPPIEWEELEPGDKNGDWIHRRFTHRCRTFVAGRWIGYTAFENEGARQRANFDLAPQLRRQIRIKMGLALLEWLDGSGPAPGEEEMS